MIRLAMAAALLVAAGIGAPDGAAAQTATRCDGQAVTMRVSRLTANGTLAGLSGAVAAQRAWYASHGLKGDSIALAPVLRNGRASAREFVTLHVRNGGAPDLKRDAAWEAFVARYKANATIADETRFCLPKGTKLGG